MTLKSDTVMKLAQLCERNGKLDLDVFAYQIERITKRQLAGSFMHITEPPSFLDSIGGLTLEYEEQLQRVKTRDNGIWRELGEKEMVSPKEQVKPTNKYVEKVAREIIETMQDYMINMNLRPVTLEIGIFFTIAGDEINLKNMMESLEDYWSNPISPRDQHEAWLKKQTKEGWTYGEKYSNENKTSPQMLEYSVLPEKWVFLYHIFTGMAIDNKPNQ